jgi:hypothetical protein
MKPSQQIAEELLEQLATDQYGGNTDGFFREEKEQYKDCIKARIPLVELIEVVKAASCIELTDSECTCGSDPERSCRYCGYFIKLGNKLESLRATGKMEI